MKNVIRSLVDICLLPSGLLLPSEIETWRDKLWPAIDVGLATCSAGIIGVPLCILGILSLLSNINIE
jgi:hypothetical protein